MAMPLLQISKKTTDIIGFHVSLFHPEIRCHLRDIHDILLRRKVVERFVLLFSVERDSRTLIDHILHVQSQTICHNLTSGLFVCIQIRNSLIPTVIQHIRRIGMLL